MIRFNKNFFISVFFVQIILNCGFDIGWKCKYDTECTASNSRCVENYCRCGPGHVFNSNMTKCLKVVTSYEEECEDANQCSAYLWSGGTCELKLNNENVESSEKSICVCGQGYHYLHGRCYRSSGLGEKCETDDDCYVNSDFEASSCKNGICKCSDEFYQRESRTCRRGANGIGESCVIDLDCKLNKTKCSKEFKCVSDKQLKTFSVNFDSDENKANNSFDLATPCKTDQDCNNNTICGPDLTCICKRAYFNFTGRCIPELGERCLKGDAANIEDSICRNGRWACKPEKVVSKNNRLCRKVTKEIEKSCLHNEECYIFGPDAECDKKCICTKNSHYVDNEKFCWMNKGIGENCSSNYDCHIPGSEFDLTCEKKDATNSVCTCPKGSLPNAEKTICLKIPTGINAKCTKSEDCKIKNGDCISNVCSCSKNFIPISDNECVEVSSYGNKCDHHIQCNATLTNGICSRTNDKIKGEISTSGICTCDHTDHYNNGDCFKKKFLSEFCQNESECFLEKNIHRVRCTNGICACDRDYRKSGNKICEKTGINGRFSLNGGSAVIYLPIWIGLIATVCNLLIS